MIKNVNKKLVALAMVSILSIGALIGCAVWLLKPKEVCVTKDFNTITINARYNHTARQVSATQSIEYMNRSNQAKKEIKFHIYANAYQEGVKNPPIASDEITRAYPNGKSFGGITIHNTSVDGTEITHTIDGEDDTVLIVPLATPLQPNQSVVVNMNWTVQLANIKHRLGWTVDAVNLANFYPIPVVFQNGKWYTFPYSSNGDPFFNEMHNYRVNIEAPTSMTIASSGELVDGVFKTHKPIRDFAMVLSNNFKVVEKTVNRINVKYYYLEDNDPMASLEISAKSVNTFSRLFAKYPYRQLSVVQTDFLHGGMEYGKLVYVSRDFLSNGNNDRENHNYVIVHEVAHQWWYGTVGNNQSSTAWIDEGLAEYSTMLFFEEHPEYNVCRVVAVQNARDNYSAYIRLVRGLGETPDTNMNRDLSLFSSSFEYVFMAYVRGLLLFVDLETVISRDKLISALRNYSHQMMFGIACQTSLIETIERTTNMRVGLFFQTYLVGWDGFQR